MSQEDKAQEVELFQWQLLNENRSPAKEYQPGESGYGPELCANSDCEDEMPELRRRLGKQFCTECQSTAEALAKRRY